MTINTDFDPQKDYFDDLKDNEKWSEGGREYPYLKGLKRLAHTNRGGVKEVRSNIVKVPSVDSTGDKGSNPDCIAAVTISYYFGDGTVFEGSADASFKAHKSPYNLHLVATAESKAEARAIRRALNIAQVAKEEMGSGDETIEEDRSDEPISDVQIEGIKSIAKRKKLGPKGVLNLIKRDDIADISELTHAEGILALKAVNKYKPKPEPKPEPEPEPVEAASE